MFRLCLCSVLAPFLELLRCFGFRMEQQGAGNSISAAALQISNGAKRVEKAQAEPRREASQRNVIMPARRAYFFIGASWVIVAWGYGIVDLFVVELLVIVREGAVNIAPVHQVVALLFEDQGVLCFIIIRHATRAYYVVIVSMPVATSVP